MNYYALKVTFLHSMKLFLTALMILHPKCKILASTSLTLLARKDFYVGSFFFVEHRDFSLNQFMSVTMHKAAELSGKQRGSLRDSMYVRHWKYSVTVKNWPDIKPNTLCSIIRMNN